MSDWLKRVLLCACLAGGMLALGAVAANAAEPSPGALIDQTQTATNTNSTEQNASSDATTDQDNVNAQLCVLCANSQNGDVTQSNDATTDSSATNNNATGQSIDQGQVASIGNDSVAAPKDPQEQNAENSNDTKQDADSTATTDQKNVNAQLCVLCYGAQNGNVDQSNDATTTSEAKNNNYTTQAIGQDQASSITGGDEHPCDCDNHDGGEITQSQKGSNSNATDQKADSSATTDQENKNFGIGILTLGTGNGDVNQSNDAYTGSKAENNNATGQWIDQDQTASSTDGDPCNPCTDGGGAPISQSQDAYNGNRTKQKAYSDATTNQENKNFQVWILSANKDFCDCNREGGGNVDQSNKATTSSEAKNNNATGQWIDQDQTATSSGGGRPCPCEPEKPTYEHDLVDGDGCPCEDGDGITQTQKGSNYNDTYQKAESSATTTQENKNFGFNLLTLGTGNGDVNQSNDATTTSEAKNNNWTGQGIWQDQTASSTDGDPCDPCDHGAAGPISQSQDAYNGNKTTQKAYSDATTDQTNKNFQFWILSIGGDRCDPCDGGGGNVTQSNKAYTGSKAKNNNWTGQGIWQNQTASSTGGAPCCPPKDECRCPPKEDGVHDGDGWLSDGKDCQCEPDGDTVGWFEKDCMSDCQKECGGDGGAITQTQCGANSNNTYQKAKSSATTTQENKNFGFNLLTLGTGNGDVTQSNDAYTRSKAKNNNWTGQAIWQNQEAVLRREPPTTADP